MQLSSITVLVGHAGVGKTNVALGFALSEAAAGHDVTVADLDVVNPYFRSSDYGALLDASGVRLIAPVLAGTTLDTPSLTGELDAAIGQAVAEPERKRLILDVGGDDDGATTIGRWSALLRDAQARGLARVLYVVSAYRALTQTPEEAAAMLPSIEDHAHLKADAVLNTSNLGDETTAEHVEHGIAFARRVSELCRLPLVATIAPEVAACEGMGVISMPRYIRLPWDAA